MFMLQHPTRQACIKVRSHGRRKGVVLEISILIWPRTRQGSSSELRFSIGLSRVRRTNRPRRDGLMVSLSASHALCGGFAPRSGQNKDHHKNGTNCLPAWHACASDQSQE